MFGGQGQDDIVGGSSDFFSLTTPYLRPDGSDLLFGGSGLHTDRNDNGLTPLGNPVPVNRHGHDADTIVGDNGDIIRIVGTGHCDYLGTLCGGATTNAKYVSFVYDNAYGEQIVVRGVTLLDYTPGGPDFRPDLFGLGTTGPCSDSGSETQNGCSVPLTVPYGTNTWVFTGHRETAGNDEIHGGWGDDFIYLGGGHDVAYGDAEDDEIIGGWGNDWISGGTGQDAILGDDGRIFGSRNSDTGYTAGRNTGLPTNCTGNGNGACFSEPLFGITAFRPVGTCPENHSVLCDDFIDQYIASPGEVQTEVINIRGDLKKTVDLTPYNLLPNGQDEPKFDANNSDDIIFGGLGGERLPLYPTVIGHRNSEEPPFGLERGIAGDFLHGGAGDDAIAGGESVWNGYTQIYDRTTNVRRLNAYRTDWTRPFNPSDTLHFGADSDAWNDHGQRPPRLGEFALYDEYDPRRTVMLNADGSVNKDPNGLNALMWFLNLYSDEGPQLNGCVETAPNGTCITIRTPQQRRHRRDLRRRGQRLARRRHRPGHAVRRLGQRPAQCRRRDDGGGHGHVRRPEGPQDPAQPERHARHAPAVRRPRLRWRRARRPDRQYRRRPADRLGRRVQQLHRSVLAVRHRHRQPPGAAVAVRVPLCQLVQPGCRPDSRHRPERARSRSRGPQRRAVRRDRASSRRRTTGSGRTRPAARRTRSPATSPAAGATSSARSTSATARCRRSPSTAESGP